MQDTINTLLKGRIQSTHYFRSETFVDVKSGRNGSLYALTSSGILLYILESSGRAVEVHKTVNMQVGDVRRPHFCRR